MVYVHMKTFHSCEPLRGKFAEGCPVSSLVAFALESSWAKTALPWGIYLRRAFPKQAPGHSQLELPSFPTTLKYLLV